MDEKVRRVLEDALAAAEARIADLQRELSEVDDERESLAAALQALGIREDVDGPVVGEVVEHTGKYRDLWRFLVDGDRQPRTMTFEDIEQEVLGFPLPQSCRRHEPHWYGYDGSAVARAIRDAGWRSSKVDLRSETVTFVPMSDG